MDNEKTAMIWFESPSGSGHASVTAQTVQALLEEETFDKIVIASGSVGRYQNNFDFVPEGYEDKVEIVDLMPFVRHHNGDGEVVTYIIDDQEIDFPVSSPVWQSAMLRKHYQNTLLEAFETHQPDILITEMYPAERQAFEFAVQPLLERANNPDIDTKTYALVRDVILDDGSGESLQDVEQAAKVINQYYDAVIVRGEQLKNKEGAVIYSLEDTWDVAKDIESGKVIYAGWFVNELPAPRNVTDDEQVDILVSAGGHWSSHAVQMYKSALDVAAETDKQMLIVTPRAGECKHANEGILEAHIEKLEAEGKNLDNVEMVNYTPHFREIMAEAESVFLQGGYNGMLEAIRAEKNVVISAQALDAPHHGEAFFRADKFDDLGIITHIKAEELADGKTLTDALLNQNGKGPC